MVTFLYRCPKTRLHVQGWVADDLKQPDKQSYEAVTCLACGGVHLVNSASGARSAPQLGDERHRAGAAAGTAHRHQDVLLLILFEIGAVEYLPRLLLEQLMQRADGNGHPGKYPERVKLDLKKPARPANRVNVAALPETMRAASCARLLYCLGCWR